MVDYQLIIVFLTCSKLCFKQILYSVHFSDCLSLFAKMKILHQGMIALRREATELGHEDYMEGTFFFYQAFNIQKIPHIALTHCIFVGNILLCYFLFVFCLFILFIYIVYCFLQASWRFRPKRRRISCTMHRWQKNSCNLIICFVM